MKSLDLSRCALITGMAVALLLVACNRPGLSEFNAPDKKQIAKNVVLHRTSGSVVTLTDDEGVGLVYGNVKRIGFEPGGKRYLLVGFEPFSSDAGSSTVPGIEVVKIELSSGQATALSDPDGSIAKSLESINSFF